jgi:hypothetical protein
MVGGVRGIFRFYDVREITPPQLNLTHHSSFTCFRTDLSPGSFRLGVKKKVDTEPRAD